MEAVCSKSYKILLSVLPNSLYSFTVVVTGVLSVIRSISIIFPFFKIRKTGVYAFLLIFSAAYVVLRFFNACNRPAVGISLSTAITGLNVLVVAVTGVLFKKSYQNIGTTGGRNEAQENIYRYAIIVEPHSLYSF